jgi:hypothetical protein
MGNIEPTSSNSNEITGADIPLAVKAPGVGKTLFTIASCITIF